MTEPGSSTKDTAHIIGTFYRFAAADVSFADLLDVWDGVIDHDHVTVDPGFDQQAEQAGRILDGGGAWMKDRPLAETVERYAHPAILLSAAGRMIAVNAAAQAAFDWNQQDMLWSVDGRRPRAAVNDTTLQERLANDRTEGIIGFLEAYPIGEERAILMALSRVRCSHDQDICCLMTGLAPVWRDRTVAALQTHFRLTDTEMAVVQELVIGGDAADVARRRGTRLATIRAQIRSILQKTRFDSQLDLLRHMGFVLQLDPRFLTAEEEALTPADLVTDRLPKVAHVLKEGRRIDVALVGPPDGAPVLFLHGIIDSVEFPENFVKALFSRKLRLIAPVRPGYAASDPPAQGALLDTVATDMFDLLDGLGVQRFTILGHMAGSLYGIAMAGQRPDRVAGIVGAAGAAPIVHSWQFDRMSRGHRISGRTSVFAPRVLRLLAKAGLMMLKKKRDDEMIDLFFRDSPHDAALAERPELRAMVLRRFHAATAQGVEAFCQDVGLVSIDWTDRMDEVRCPVVMAHGRHDNVVVIDGVRLFAEAHDQVRLIEHPEAGQLILTQAPEMILDEVAALTEMP